MTYGHKKVGPNWFREDIGRYYEDFKPGDIYEHRPGRTITEGDNAWFTLLTMNTHPLHFDAVYAAKSEFGAPLVNSTFTIAVVVGMSVSDTSQKAIANLGWRDIKLVAPVFVGDTLYAESEVIEKRDFEIPPQRWNCHYRNARNESRPNAVLINASDLPGAQARPFVRRRSRLLTGG